ncbi:hypothetical protein EDB81DRAFT_842273 [Dactylonectria macrodidyma]|uniref:Tyrosinase copper-binding domain-containing protein n=1 Tax=Dactylonectria macrodidyma TaxID=307937 RepID=A0A9P9F0N9_9HYPO|nr:hypothetical protein EDB81DRAFT_842273 [Dactylonectria macrodidyma]
MRLSSLLAVVALATEATVATSSSSACGCTKPLVRKEWRTLSTAQKKEYITAVKCLASKPSQTGGIYEGAKSRYDDFVATHIVNTDDVHFVLTSLGILPSVSASFGTACSSTSTSKTFGACAATLAHSLIGTNKYPDWSLDSDSAEAFLNSPLFDPKTGFGGNGPFVDSTGWTNITRQIPDKLGGGCVVDGPFVESEFKCNMGPEKTTAYNPRCMRRDIAPSFAVSKLNQAKVDWTLEAKDYYEFDIRVEGGITVPTHGYHGGGHLGIGGDLGEVGDVYTSPGDPLFYMHHANMDRLWNKWQHLDWDTRKSDISGPDTQFAYPFDFFGADPAYKNITLDYVMNFNELIPDRQYIKVKEVMDIQGGLLCYKYQE